MAAKEAPSGELIPRRWWWVFLGTGIGTLLLGILLAVVLSVPFVVDAPGGLDLPFVDEYPTVTEILQPPFVCFLFGGCFAFVGELLRRGTMLERRGANVAIFRPLGLGFHAAWLVVALVTWGFAMPGLLTLVVGAATETSSLISLDADSDPIFLIGAYGGLAALMVGAILGSLVKKAWFLAVGHRRGASAAGSTFWWTFSFYWRGDVWIAAFGGLLLGLAPLPIHFGSDVGAAVTLGVGALVLLTGLAACTQYWRAGMPPGVGTSITGGYDSLLAQTPERARGSDPRT